MRLPQGELSFLPGLTAEAIKLQCAYALEQGWALAVEFTDDPHPRNTYWEMWGTPMFDLKDAAGALFEVNECRKAHSDKYIKVLAFDRNKGFESIRMFFLVNRPQEEPGFDLVRSEGSGRTIGYTIRSYAVDRPPSQRYR